MKIKNFNEEKKEAIVILNNEELSLMKNIEQDKVKGGIFRCLSKSGEMDLLKDIPNIEIPTTIFNNEEKGILGRV